MKIKGIDVSKYQGKVDFKRVRAAGYSFVILNAGYGRYITQKDPYFEENYKNARAAGLQVGAYWYSYAKTAADAATEADVFLKAVEGKSFGYPLCCDLEDECQRSLSREVIGAMVKAFCGRLEERGYYAALYSYASFLKDKVPSDIRSRYDVWVAHFGVDKPAYTGSYGMWQYSSTASVPGVSGNCDCDWAYRDYPGIMAEKGLNGFGKKALDTEGFRSGDRGLGVYALKGLLDLARERGETEVRLDDNDIFGEGTEKAVNGLLSGWGYAENGIAGMGVIGRLSTERK